MKKNQKRKCWISILLTVMMICTLLGTVSVKTSAEETTETEISTTETAEKTQEPTSEAVSEKASTEGTIQAQASVTTEESTKSVEKSTEEATEESPAQETTVKKKTAKAAKAGDIVGEQWCTNRKLGSKSLSTTVENAETNYGAEAEKFTDSSKTDNDGIYVYWQTRYLTGNDKQTATMGNNGTKKGVQVDRIRYNSSEGWQYSSDDGDTFKNISNDGQLVFYYFMRTSIQKYAQVDISDWWHGLHECSYSHSKAVYIRIVDKDTGEIYDTTETFYYHSDHNGVGGIYITENVDAAYEIVGADVEGTSYYDNQPIKWDEKNPINKQRLTKVQENVDINNPISIDWSQEHHQIINLYIKKTASLSVTKRVEGVNAGDQKFDVQITLTPEKGQTIKGNYPYETSNSTKGKLEFSKTSDGKSRAVVQLKAGETIQLKGLEAGVGYQVNEIGDTSGYTVKYDGASGTTEKNGNHKTTITNTKKQVTGGSLTLTKIFSGLKNMSGALRKSLLDNFKIQVKGKNGESYTVTPYTSLAEGSATADDMLYGNQDSYTFQWELKTLTEGEYTVEEQGYKIGDGYIQIDATVNENDGLAGPEQAVTVAANGENSVHFTNTYQVKPKTVSVTKKWKGSSKTNVIAALYQKIKGSNEETLVKSVTLSKSNQWMHTWENLEPVDDDGKEIVYTIKEMNPVSAETKDAVQIDGTYYLPVANGGIYQDNYKVDYSHQKDAYTITNTYQPKLTITKEVEGAYGDLTKAFEIKLTAKDANGEAIADGTYGNVYFENGEATVHLKNGETAEIIGLPDRTGYEVTEAGESSKGYEVSYNSQRGTIAAGGEDVHVTVTNTSTVTPDTGIFGMGNHGLKALGILLAAAAIIWALRKWKHMRY